MKTIQYIGIALFALTMVSCANTEKETTPNEPAAAEERTYPVKVATVEQEIIDRPLEYTSNLAAFKEIYFAPVTPGRISKILVEEDDRIQKGQLLVEMDKTQLNQAKIQNESAKINFQRIDTLYRLGSASEQQHEQLKTQYDLTKMNVEYLTENTHLLSPINGVVTDKHFENGELFSGAPNTVVGKAAILTLMQINPMKALVSVSQSYFNQIKKGMEAEINTSLYPDKVFNGKVDKIHPTIDAATRTFKVEVLIDNPKEELRPGMFAAISINMEKTKALVVPSITVLKQEGTNNRYVFVNNKGVAKKVSVEVGKRFDDKIEIISDEIAVGTQLIVEGQANLMDGSKIDVLN
ncbi:MAG: efflux RND transporter periplasmic adaptor subunit [Salinivirgaceae bacterium]